MPKNNHAVTGVSDIIQDTYEPEGAQALDLDAALASMSLSKTDTERALSLIKLSGNAVFIAEGKEAARGLMIRALRQLRKDTPGLEVIQLDLKKLLALNKAEAARDFQSIIHRLREAEGKACLVLFALEEVTQEERIASILREAVHKKLIPVLGATNLAGFRKLEENTALSGQLQFILAEKEISQAKRDKSVLVIGASSFFGSALFNLFSREYKVVRGTGFSKSASLGLDKLDVRSEQEIKEYFSRHPDFDIVIYTAGEPDADVAEKEKDRAQALNTAAVALISRYAKNCKFVYISSEYVFDGSSGPYGSGSAAKPINYYGSTKLEGEKAALKNFPDALVLRLGALYGYNGPQDKATTVSKLIAGLNKPEPLKADNVQIKHPVLLEDAARALLKLLDYDARGIYQVNGPEGLNKREMAERIASARKEATGCAFAYPIVGIEQPSVAEKPLNTHMVNVDTPRPFDEGIYFLLQKIR